MKLSIAMATYNGAAYVSEQLTSFATQTRLPDELVITDDNSSDDTPQIIRQFARTAPFPVRFEQNPANLGFAGNFSRALSLASGDLVFLSDQDDSWYPEKLAQMAALATQNPTALCLMNDAALADGQLTPSGRTKLAGIRAAGLPDSAFVMGCCAVFRRELLEVALPVPSLMRAHDNWLVGVSDAFGRTVRHDKPLQLYRLHGANTSDFFVNRPTVPPLHQRIIERLLRGLARFTSTRGFEGEYNFHAALNARLTDRGKDIIALVGEAPYQQVHHTISAKLVTLSSRWNMRARPRHRRPESILRLWRQGGYTSALGPLKDMLVPRRTLSSQMQSKEDVTS